MKILYLHQYFKFPNEAGATRSFDLAAGLISTGYEVEMITTTSDKSYKNGNRWCSVEKNGLVVHYIYLPYGNHLSYLERSLVFFKFLWFSTFKLLTLKGDVVLATSTPLTIGIPALVKKWMSKTPFVFEVRDVWPEAVIAVGALNNQLLQKLLYSLEGLIYKNADVIVPLSIDMKSSIVYRFPTYEDKLMEVVENISEVNRFQNEYNTSISIIKEAIGFKPRFTVLYAGTFGKVNGIKYVIELASILIDIDSTIVFVLIGNGAEKNHVIELAKNMGVLNNTVFILDSIPKNDLPQLYYECSMGSSFVIDIKELWANSANKFFDTLAASRSILINHNGWQKDVILGNNIGYILPYSIDKESAIDFARYTQDEIGIEKQRVNAFKVAKEKYSLEVAIEKYTRIFNRVLKVKSKLINV